MASIGSSYNVPPTDAVSSADIVIGISGTGGAGALEAAIGAARSGIAEYLDPDRTRIVVAESDPGSAAHQYAESDTPTRVPLTAVAYDVDSRDLLRLPYHGLPGRAHALRALLEAARAAGARACVVLDASLHHDVTPEHVRWLVRPIIDDQMDFVTPYHPRHTADGAITKSILYPMFRAVFGCAIRQPAAREFGCSSAALEHLLAQRVWEEVGRDEAIDIWMTTEAVCGGLRVSEAQLAPAEHVSDAVDASTALSQIAGSLFVEVERRAARWQRMRNPMPACQVGPITQPHGPEPVIDVRQLIESFQLGYADLQEVWAEILPPVTLLELKALAHAPADRFRLDDRMWARIVYDFAVGHRLQMIRREHLLGSLTPLYFGWLSSFVIRTQDACAASVDERLDEVYQGFEAEKPYLISRWRWPERFRS
jgi:hypothetical protein